MMLDDSRPPRWLVVLRWALLGLAVIASVATALILGYAVYLFILGYSGGNNPESDAPLAFPIAIAIYAFVGVPTALVCALAWAGYYAVTRRIRRSSR
jgi:drug/metabolite transporter (DMT)-like permease